MITFMHAYEFRNIYLKKKIDYIRSSLSTFYKYQKLQI